MMSNKISLLLVVLLITTSCATTYNMKSIELEMMKPGLFTFLDNMDTIAIFKRDFYQCDTLDFTYLDEEHYEELRDTALRNSDLSNQCVDALAVYLQREGQFDKVTNYRDTANYLFKGEYNRFNNQQLAQVLGVDVCINLDYFKLKDRLINNSYFFDSSVIENFPEFSNTTKMEHIKTNLLWTISFRGDTSLYICKEPDNLYYGNSVNPEFFGSNHGHRLLLQNVAVYLGEQFGNKLIPSWQKVQRNYYRSNNLDMLQAEKYLLEGNWREAAEIYKKETTNKNPNIAAKATYNMAFICEMEGELDAASDWLNRSTMAYKRNNPTHQFNCTEYNASLLSRKKEVNILDRQMRVKGK